MNNIQREFAESEAEVSLMIRRVLPELTINELLVLWLGWGLPTPLGNNEIARRLHLSKQRVVQIRQAIGAKLVRLGVADPADRLEKEIEHE